MTIKNPRSEYLVSGAPGLATAVLWLAARDAEAGCPEARDFLCSRGCADLLENLTASWGLEWDAERMIAALMQALDSDCDHNANSET
jgi:hypothetical protein